MDIKSFLTRHPRLNYLQRCLRHWNDRNFIAEVLDIGRNPLKIEIERLGDKNPGRLIYIAQTMGCDGFFAELRFILHELYFCKQFGFVPVVRMPKSSCYAEPTTVNGTDNPFEYYFERVSNISVEDALYSSAVIKHNFYQSKYIYKFLITHSGYTPSETYIEGMASLYREFIRVNKQMSLIIERSRKKIVNEKWSIGVHIRGADFKRHYSGHPQIVSAEEHIEAVERLWATGNYGVIFLATDDVDALKKFVERFDRNVVYFSDVVRTGGDETVMRSDIAREMHHYKLGMEVIRDMYTLSYCDALVAGLSNVSMFARIVKSSRKENYKEIVILDKGIAG